MTISRPCYTTREAVSRAADIKYTARIADAVDRAIESASENIDSFTNRRFYTATETNTWDWPNWQHTYPWRVWLNDKELAGQPTLVTSGSVTPVTIPSANYLVGPYGPPPYNRIDLRLDKSSSFGNSPTWQQDISITGPFGYWQKTRAAGALAATISSASATTITVTNGNLVGVGDVLIVDNEHMIVTDKRMASTGVTWSGLSSDSAADNLIQVPDSTLFDIGETLLADAERVWVADIIASNTLVVKRGWDGTVLAEHTGGILYAARQLVVTRGDLGSTAATHSNATAISTRLIPSPVRDLALAEAAVQVAQEPGAYAGSQGSEGIVSGIGASLADKWQEVETGFSRQLRIRAV